MKYTARIYQAWSHRREYTELQKWSKTIGAKWSQNSATTWINGEVFYGSVHFEYEADLLVCLLKFPEIAIRGITNSV